MGPVFRCERTGLSTVLLGGYDGTGTWTIIGPDISDGAEHLVVQAHEAMHHELQLSTTWGRLCAILGLLGQRTARPARYLDLFDAAVDESRTVHELYATVLSDGTATQRAARDVLADNPTYAGYRTRARALTPHVEGVADDIHLSAIAAILRCCMHPQRALDATGSLPDGLVPKLLGGPDCPDERLGAFEAHTDPAAGVGLLGELQAADPGHHRDIQGRRLTEPEDLPALSKQWRHEVQTVCSGAATNSLPILSAAGSVTLGWSALPSAAATAVAAVDPELLTNPALLASATGIMAQGTSMLFGMAASGWRWPARRRRRASSSTTCWRPSLRWNGSRSCSG